MSRPIKILLLTAGLVLVASVLIFTKSASDHTGDSSMIDEELSSYTGHGLSFVYPSDWSVVEDPDSVALLGLYDDNGALVFKVYRHQASAADFDQYYEAERSKTEEAAGQFETEAAFSFEELTVSGYPAFVQKRDFFSMIGEVYDLTVWTNDGSVTTFSADHPDHRTLDLIYGSVQVES